MKAEKPETTTIKEVNDLQNPIWFANKKNADKKTTTFCTDAPNGLR